MSVDRERSGRRGDEGGMEMAEIRVLPAEGTSEAGAERSGNSRAQGDLSTVNSGPQQVR